MATGCNGALLAARALKESRTPESTRRAPSPALCGQMGPRSAVTRGGEGAQPRSNGEGSRCSRRGGGAGEGSSTSPPPTVLSNPKSVLKRPVSIEELQTPGGPFVRKIFTVMGDEVGWGFVVRGNTPCYIQAVEPRGPAAVAGMKVRQFLVSVNGLNVLYQDYRSVSRLILTGPRNVVMEVMEEVEH